MPTIIKSSSKVASLGDLSTYSIGTAAIPYDTADTSGSIPTVSVTMAGSEETDYLIGESLTISNQAIGKYSGEIVDVSGATNSGRTSLTVDTIISRLNSEQRLYPAQKTSASTFVPLAALEYWSQQCGIFYDAVDGDVLFYQSQFAHWFAFAKGTTKPIRGMNYIPTGVAGENVSSEFTLAGRYITSFGKNRDLTVPFPAAQMLPVQIPPVADTRLVVFSSGVYNQGTGRQATITWNLLTPTKQPVTLRVVIDNSVGIYMQIGNASGGFTTLGTAVAAAVNGNYRLNIGVTSVSTTQTSFTLSVLDSSGAVVGTSTANATTNLAGNLSLASINYRGEDQGSGDQICHWGDSIAILPSMPTKRYTDQKAFTAGPKAAQVYVGFSGNVWENIKAYCSIYHLEVSCVDGKLTIGPRPTNTTSVQTLAPLSKRLSKRDQARFVEVVCQNSKPTLSADGTMVSPQVMWKADSVYQVAVGEVQEFLVQTDHSILELQQPVAVSGISPFPYKSGTGQYVVTGSDGYIVSPTFWRDQGGKITVETTQNEGEIKIIIKGPDYDSPRAPYRISEGDAGRPALYITGQGVINTPQTLKVSTGNTRAAKEVGVTLESPFIADLTLAYDAAARAARKFATPDVAVSISEALGYDATSDLGQRPAGQLIKRDGNILRVTDTSQTPAALSGTAVQHNTIKQVKKSFGPAKTLARTNVVDNPKASTGLTGFTAGNGTISRATTGGPSASVTFARATATATPAFLDINSVGAGLNLVVPGKVYYLDVQARASVAGNIRTFVQWKDAAGATISTVSGPVVSNTANGWASYTLTTTAAPANAVRVTFIVRLTATITAGVTLDATAFMLADGPGAYFDGSTPSTLDKQYAWTGTADASSSTETAVVGSLGQTKAYHGGKTIGQVNLKPLKVVK